MFPGVVIGEIFSLPIRSKGVALSTASNWFWNAIIGIIVPFLVDYDKADLGVKVFFIWGSTCALCAIFAWLFVPETRGLTLEQVEQVSRDFFFSLFFFLHETRNTIHHQSPSPSKDKSLQISLTPLFLSLKQMMDEVPAYRSKTYTPMDTFAESYGGGGGNGASVIPTSLTTTTTKTDRPSTAFSSIASAHAHTPTSAASFIEMDR